MTTVLSSFIAIILFGMIMISTISYGDTLGMMSAPDSVHIAQRLQSAAEMSSQIQSSTGSRPRSAEELVQAGLPAAVMGDSGEIAVSCSDEACSMQAVCLELQSSSNNVTAAKAAANRIKGVVSGQCGVEAAPIADTVVVTMWI